MDVKNAIMERRAYRSLLKVPITKEIIDSLGKAAQLMPSCFNKQPWRFIFVTESHQFNLIKEEALNKGNEWAKEASLIIAVFSKNDLDCVIKEREYYLFDTGMAVAAILLQATELGLVAHPIAGYSPEKTRKILKIPEEFNVITLIIVGKKNPEIPEYFDDWKKKSEKERPSRIELDEFLYRNEFTLK